MNISFDTNSMGQPEVKGLILFLSNLLPTDPRQAEFTFETATAPMPANEKEAVFGVDIRPSVVEAAPEPETTETKRKRRTKAEIAADEAATAQITRTESAASSLSVQVAGVAEAINEAHAEGKFKLPSADELRDTFKAFAVKKGMADAIALLGEFGCGRVSEVADLDAAKIAEFAARCNG